jgi:transposase
MGEPIVIDSTLGGGSMATAYSADMRLRVIGRVESGASRREAAEHYEVSPSTAVIWVKCFRETGRCAAKPRGGSTSPLEKHADFLLALIEVEPDLTLDEVICAMRENKIPGSRTAVWRFFQRHRITFKKNLAGGRAAASGRGAGAPALDARTRPVRSGPAGVHR